MEDNTKYNRIVDRINLLDEWIRRTKRENEFGDIGKCILNIFQLINFFNEKRRDLCIVCYNFLSIF